MDKIKITEQESKLQKNRTIKITWDQLFQPIRIQNLTNEQQVFRPMLDIIVKGHPNCTYELKYKNDTYSTTADNEGKFNFNGIRLGEGRNCFDIINPDKRNIANQHIQFAVRFETARLIYIGKSDPITGQQFSSEDDITGIDRCQKCHTFYYSESIAECSHRCPNCGHNQFWNYGDDDFYREIRN
ncbi:MAG: hypothetical protein ACM3SY_07190 [Candidatus Omnitrophota bacterium]